MSIKKRIEKLEKETKLDTKTDGIFNDNDPKDRHIKGLCDRHGIAYDSNIVPIWKKYLIVGDDNVPGT